MDYERIFQRGIDVAVEIHVDSPAAVEQDFNDGRGTRLYNYADTEISAA